MKSNLKKLFIILMALFLIQNILFAQNLLIEESSYTALNDKIIKTTILNGYSECSDVFAEGIIEFEKNIVFYDTNGKIINEVNKENENIFNISKKGKYVVIFQRIKEPTKENRGLDLFKFYDNKGNLLWTKNSDTGFETFDNVEHIFISDKDGTAVLVYPYLNKIEFYDANGELQNLINSDLYGPFEGEISEDGEYFTFITGKKGNINVSLYTIKGDEIWKKNITDHIYKGYIKLFPNAKYIIASSYSFINKELVGTTYVFDKTGEIVKKFDIFFSQSSISDDNRFIALSHRGGIAFIDLKNWKILFNKNEFIIPKVGKDIYGILSTSVNSNGEYVLIGSGRKSNPPDQLEIFIVNRNGEVVFNKKYLDEKCSMNTNFCVINKNILLVFNNKIIELKIQNK